MTTSLLFIAMLGICQGFLHPPPAIFTERYLQVGKPQTTSLFLSTEEAASNAVNGENSNDLTKMPEIVSEEPFSLDFAPPLSYEKYVIMQEKRVVVTVRYSQGMKPFYLTVAKKIKTSHPDILIEKRILPPPAEKEAPAFDVLVDGKVTLGRQSRKQKAMQVDSGEPRVFVSMYDLDLAIARARRKRRPTTVYGDEKKGAAMRILKKG